MRLLPFLFSLLVCGSLVRAATRPSEVAHPRLLFPASAEAAVKEKIETDPLAAELQKNLLQRADEVLRARTCRFEKSDGKRLLPESRTALHHILHCAWAWRTTADRKYWDRAIAEMEAACAMPSWNPEHFLDTAEMSAAMAIGYDWLYRDLSPQQRAKYAQQIDEKGLQALSKHKSAWWKSPTNNWSQVCGTGMEFAAIAIDESQPQRCAEVLAQARKLVDDSLCFYQPDGAYPEGPDYWHYGSNYHAMHEAANDSLFGKTTTPEIWRRSAEFMIHLSGPTGVCFNYADGGMRGFYPTAAQTWIAAQFPQSSLPGLSRDAIGEFLKSPRAPGFSGDSRFHPLHLLWLPKAFAERATPALTARFGGEQEIAFARTDWSRDAAWLAIKGGTGAASHGHLDAGTFVYEAAGLRWFVDLGKENYNLPGYFGKQRWSYFRLNNRSHNTLVIGDALQATPKPGCPVTPWVEEGTRLSRCEVDLTPAYSPQCASAKRLVLFDRTNGSVNLTDLIDKPIGAVRWAVVTDASVKIQGRQVLLQKQGKTLVLQREDITGGDWQEFSLQAPTAQENTNKGYRMIGFTVAAQERVEVSVNWQLAPNNPTP